MRVLVACEFSGTVRDAFIARGHEAMSCDLLPSEAAGPHYTGDVRDVLDFPWDMMIAHPPCNHLAASGAQYWPGKWSDGRQAGAVSFFMALAKADIPRIVIENPVGIMSRLWRKPDQTIQPWQFGQAFNKKTCLWLTGLPELRPSKVVEPTHNWGSNSYRSGTRKNSPLPSLHWGSQDRARTFPGIADAMADQWGALAERIAA